MKQIWSLVVCLSCMLLFFSCNKNNEDSGPVISNLVYNPHVVTINLNTTAFYVTGTIDYRNADGGVSKFRLTNSAGADFTMELSTFYSEPSGQITGAFEFMMPGDPVTHTFDIWIVDNKGKSSNKLSGSVQFIR